MDADQIPAEIVEQFAMSEWERTRRHIAGGPLDIPGLGPWAELGDEAQAAGRVAARAALAAAWPLIAEEIGKALPAVLNLQGVWDSSVPPGGFVCPLCGEPWESEPSCQHAKDVAWYDGQVRAGALEKAADEIRDYVWQPGDGDASVLLAPAVQQRAWMRGANDAIAVADRLLRDRVAALRGAG